MSYNFKAIKTVLNSQDLINVILSKTQRKTPTVVHPGYSIGRIKGFYIRKVQFTQDSISEKLTDMLDGFPKLEDIHPFFSDLINVLYDKDHYKLALGHIHSCKNLIDNIAKDYVRLIKYGDSLYRCKMLKKAALGRMCTILKKLNSSLLYLEEVRKHMSRLPAINPFEQSLLITGYPNVGKSSFINQITHANVEVQPYPFTTQSLYVGHTDFNYSRWQVIDSPGILDRPLEQRNTIEMQSITALAHLKACILYFIDISETCSYSIEQQVSLFNNIKPLFKNKPLVIVLTKIDLRQYEELDSDQQLLITQLCEDQNVQMTFLSNKSGDGIVNAQEFACNALLAFRESINPDLLTGGNKILKNEENVLRGVYVGHPKTKDGKQRTPFIPQDFLKGWKRPLGRPTLQEVQEQNGGAGAFNFPLQQHFLLENPDWKYDIVPEIMNGKNIIDFVDKDILKRLDDLELEEEKMAKARQNQMSDEESDLDSDLENAHKEIVSKQAQLRLAHKLQRHKTAHVHQVTEEDIKEKLGEKSNQIIERARSRTPRRKLENLVTAQDKPLVQDDSDLEMDDQEVRRNQQIKGKLNLQKRSLSRSRSKGYMGVDQTETDKALERLKHKIDKQWEGRAGEGDRRIPCQMPKHLYSGQRGIGQNERR